MRSGRLAGVALVVVSAAAFGALGVLAHVAYEEGADPVAVLMARFALAAVCYIPLWLARRRPLPSRRTVAGLAGMGLCYLGQSLCYFTAVEYAPPGLVALLLYTYPALVVALGAVVLRLPLTRRIVTACAVAVTGTALIIGPTAGSGEPLGIVFGISAAAIYAVYILSGSRLLAGVDALTASLVISTTAATGFAVLYGLTSPRPSLPASATGWFAVVAIALVCTVLAALAFLAGLARVGPADASTISTVEPVVSVILSALVTGERITAWTVLGGAMVLASVVALSRESPAPLAEPAPAA